MHLSFFTPASIKKLASVVKIAVRTISMRLIPLEEIVFLNDPWLKKIKGRSIIADKTQ